MSDVSLYKWKIWSNSYLSLMSGCYPLFSYFEDFDWFFLRFEAPPGLPPSDPSPSVASWGAQGGPGGPREGWAKGALCYDVVMSLSTVFFPPFFLHENVNVLVNFSRFTFCFHFFHLSRFIQHFVELSFRYSFRWAVEAWTQCWMRTPRRGRYRYHCCRWRRRRRDVWQKRQDV